MNTTTSHSDGKTADCQLQTIRRLSVLIPVYNSQQTVGKLIDLVVMTLRPRYEELEIVLVNDGSQDRSHEVVCEAVKRHATIAKYIRLAKNFGEHPAVMCGLHHVTGDCVAIIDDDFQNPPEEIVGLVDKLQEGYDVVYSFYEEKHHSRFRNTGSRINDWFATRLIGKPKGLYLSSFKVINRFMVDTIVQYTGPYPYIDGLILRSTSSIGSQLCKHADRRFGRSNYTLRRLVRLWLDMFTGFSIMPLRIASLMGLLMSATGFLLTIFFVVSWYVGGIFREEIPPGWASLIASITIFAGLQLCVLGMVGEYLGRVLQTINQSPQFIVRDTQGLEQHRSQ